MLINQLVARHISDAKIIARQAITTLKVDLLKKPTGWTDSDMNIAFTGAVFLRAIYDHTVLVEMVAQSNWIEDHVKVEEIWTRFCNCRDRFEFAADSVQGAITDQVSQFLAIVENSFLERFGSGHYMSCELIFEKMLCSICQSDIRSCEHIPGRLFSGKLCGMRPTGTIAFPEDGSCGSLVTVPRDPRCRIWPWNFDSERKATIMFMSAFRIDDFMEKDDWS